MNYKKVLSGVLAAAVCAASTGFQNTGKITLVGAEDITQNVQADSTEPDQAFTYKESVTEEGLLGEFISYKLYSSGVLKIRGTGRMDNFEKSPFSNPEKIKAVLFDDQENCKVENIGDYTFSDCVNLYGITIPQTVTEIGIHAFSKCESITEITVPDSVTRVGEYAFEKCSGLKKAVLGKGLTKVGTSSAEFFIFNECYALEELSMPSLVTGQEIFETDKNGKEILNHSIGQINKFFNDDSYYTEEYSYSVRLKGYNLKKVTVTSGEEIFPYEFAGISIEEIILPDTISKISKGSFAYCSFLSEIFFPDSLTCIEKEAFYECASLQKINIGKEIKTIDRDAFNYCGHFLEIYFNGTKAEWDQLPSEPDIFGASVHYLQDENNNPNTDPSSDSRSEKIVEEGTLGENIKYSLFGDGALKINGTGRMRDFIESPFKNKDKISSVSFESSNDCAVENIGSNLFNSCINITKVYIPDTITSIEKSAFINCESLTEIEVPDSVTHIGESAFENCISMKKAVLGKGLVSIGQDSAEFNIFKQCISLEELSLPSLISSPDSRTENEEGKKVKGGQIAKLFQSDSTFDDGYIVAGMMGYDRLKKITVTSGTEVYPYEFIDLYNVTEIILPDTITKISEYSFSRCKMLKEIRIPESVTEIGREAFDGCKMLRSVYVGENLKKLEDESFSFCSGLEQVYYSGSEDQWNELKASSQSKAYINTDFFNAVIHYISDNKFVKTVGTDITIPKILEKNRGNGDVDGDGVTDLTDLICLSMYLLRDYDLTTSAKVYGDITKDGELDITDLPALKMIIMGGK